MSNAPPQTPDPLPKDPIEARLEAREHHKYLLAKSYFDCREYDRCAAVFLPEALPKASTNPTVSPSARAKGKGKARTGTSSQTKYSLEYIRNMSQKALFLALYAKYIAGEKRKDEDSEMILGPQDGGVTMNKELLGITVILEEWFANIPSSGRKPQGWLEYLYGIVLAKGKNEELATQYFIQSVHHYPHNWGAWQELSSLIGTVEEVRNPKNGRGSG